jgi:uncharacterized membrane protein YdjX (TVP38/TMEM64 family)
MGDLLLRLLRSRGFRGLTVLLGLGWLLIHVLERVGGPDAVRAEYGLATAAILVPAQAVAAVTPFPSELIAVVHGAVYGLALGSVFTWTGWMLGALLEYFLFRRIASDVGGAAFTARLPGWLRRFPADHPVFLIGGRLVPFGNHVVNAMAGSRGVALWRFSWATAIALVPFSVFVSAIASGPIAR